ncbi:MAG: hypothetical protein ABI758_05185 [Candidatus Woesebacteria bacterium]
MPTKQQLITEIKETKEVESDVLDILVAELSGYPEDLSPADFERFNTFVAKVQATEVQSGQTLIDAADAADDVEEKLTQSEEESAEQVSKVFQDNTENLQTLTE